MKIFVATASTQEVEWAIEAGLADGIVATHDLLREASEDADEREVLAAICQAASPLPVCASVGSVAVEDIYRDGRELAKISDQILVQIPLLEEALSAIRRLRTEGIRSVATLVHTTAQAVLAAKAGSFMIQIAVDSLDAFGDNGPGLVSDVRTVFAGHAIECDIAAALPRDSAQFAQCARAGADVITVSPAVLRALLLHPLTDRGVDHLLRDLSAHSHSRATV
jgi:transaldolase